MQCVTSFDASGIDSTSGILQPRHVREAVCKTDDLNELMRSPPKMQVKAQVAGQIKNNLVIRAPSDRRSICIVVGIPAIADEGQMQKPSL